MRLRPSPALVRAAVLLGLTGALTALTHQVALLVLAAPFAVWCALGVLRRPGALPEPEGSLGAHRVQLGDVVEYRLRGTPGTLVGLTVPPPPRCDLDPPSGAVTGLGEAAVRVRPQRWGRHRVEPAEGVVGDDWGLWLGSSRPGDDQLSVAPGREPPGRGDAIPHPVGLVGLHPSRTRGDGVTLAEVRRFQTGDRLKRINWRVTSRTRELHTNATLAERDTEVLVVTDTLADLTSAPATPTGEPGASSLDTTVLAAASVVEHYLRLGDRVGLHDLGHVIGSVPPAAGARQRTVVVEQLARAAAERTSRPLVRRIRRVRPGSLVVVCSPLLDRDVLEEVLRLVHRGAAVLAIDTLPADLGRLEPTHRARGVGALLDAGVGRLRPQRYWAEAWALRRLERDADLERLTELGVPVVGWHGIESLGTVVAALAANRSAPRLSRGSAAGGGG